MTKILNKKIFYNTIGLFILLLFTLTTINFCVYSLQRHTYEVMKEKNTKISFINNEIAYKSNKITDIRHEKDLRLDNINAELDRTPEQLIDIRKQLNNTISNVKREYVATVRNIEKDIKELKDEKIKIILENANVKQNTIVNLLTDMAEKLNTNIESVILGFSVFVGVVLDCIAILITESLDKRRRLREHY